MRESADFCQVHLLTPPTPNQPYIANNRSKLDPSKLDPFIILLIIGLQDLALDQTRPVCPEGTVADIYIYMGSNQNQNKHALVVAAAFGVVLF